MILAGDVGGTKTALALYELSSDGLQQQREASFASREHPSLQDILTEFLKPERGHPLHAACFGVPGAVIDGRAQITNLPWVVEEKVLAGFLNTQHVKLLNDLEATAYGTLFLRSDEVSILNPGTPPTRPANVAVIAAGTGLGEAILYSDGAHHYPIASEGGHADFAPRSDEQIDLLRYLRDRCDGRHVSYERVLSGPGLHNIYNFLRDTKFAPEPRWLADALASGDPSATIAAHGLAGDDALCIEALHLFVSIYGAEAGNLALKCLAIGGVFVAGGIAPKILPVLQNGGFVRSFIDKGRCAEVLRRIPVKVALTPNTPLLGAAHLALRL
jgi:glucokinase